MSFQIKSFNDIVLSQINHARAVTEKITDFAPGSVARTLMEAPAVEVEELYLQMFLGLRDAIPVATFLSFGFDRLPAAKARGFVTVSKFAPLTDPISIPAGTIFSTLDERQYESIEAVTWGAGTSVVRVPVSCTVPGVAGNVAAGVITESSEFTPAGGYTVTNSLIETGRDVESDQEREARFAEFIASLSRGTVTACLFAARQSVVLDDDGNIAEFVTRAGIQEDPGRVRIYLYSSAGVPSAALIADGQLRLDGTRNDQDGTITPGVRPAGVRVDVLPMVERAVNMAVQVGMLPGYSLSSAVVQGLQDAFASSLSATLPGQTLYLGTLVEAMLEVEGVRTVVPSLSQNVVCAVNEALVAGDFTATPL